MPKSTVHRVPDAAPLAAVASQPDNFLGLTDDVVIVGYKVRGRQPLVGRGDQVGDPRSGSPVGARVRHSRGPMPARSRPQAVTVQMPNGDGREVCGPTRRGYPVSKAKGLLTTLGTCALIPTQSVPVSGRPCGWLAKAIWDPTFSAA